MKKIIFAFIAFTLVISSCKKYEEGPAISLRSKKARVAGEWKIDKVMLNGDDITSSVVAAVGSDYTLHIEKDGSYHAHGTTEDEGTWQFAEKKEEIHMLSSTAGAEEEHYEILKLKNDELWLKHEHDASEVYEFHYKQ